MDGQADLPIMSVMQRVERDHQTFSWLVGNWNLDGATTDDSPWRAGKFTATQRVESMGDGQMLKSHLQYRGHFNDSSQDEFFGVDPDTKRLSYHAFSTTGIMLTAEGEYADDRSAHQGTKLSWTSTRTNLQGEQFTSTYTIKQTAPHEYEFSLEGADGKVWMHGKAQRQ